MASFAYMVERAKVLNEKVTNSFGNAKIRSQETFGLPLGFEFEIPKDGLEVHWQVMPNAPVDPDTGLPQETPYLIVKKKGAKDTDEDSGIRFYPSTLTKMAFEANVDGSLTNNIIRAKGSAVNEYIKYHKVDDGIRALAGLTLKVTKIDQVRVRRFGNQVGAEKTRMTNIPTIDIVQEEQEKKGRK